MKQIIIIKKITTDFAVSKTLATKKKNKYVFSRMESSRKEL